MRTSDRIAGLIRKLTAISVDNGATPEEAMAAAKAERDRRYELKDVPALPSVKGVRQTDSARAAGRAAGRDVTISTPISGGSPPAGLLTGA